VTHIATLRVGHC